LDELANFLLKYPNLRIEVGGHTNGLPAHAYCDKLSSERAAQVAKYLISKGLSPEQISSKGYGKRLPLADNAIESGRRQNQRVEIKVLKI
jgi:outer membrane protein OmpA-like peptidoglycan-associated protein